MKIRKVCIFCASSRQVHADYFKAANTLGKELASQGLTIVYGGGAVGLMGALADSALAVGGTVTGIIPHFMVDLEWGHTGLTDLKRVDDMHERKRLMIEGVDAVIALPGGCGTLEELLEVITLKRLGLFLEPIIIVNIRQFFDPLIQMLNKCIGERFMRERHRKIWTVIEKSENALKAIESSTKWEKSSQNFAAL